jgi:hypothetical protein
MAKSKPQRESRFQLKPFPSSSIPSKPIASAGENLSIPLPAIAGTYSALYAQSALRSFLYETSTVSVRSSPLD